MVCIGGQPLIVIEAEGDEKKFEDGFRQARAYAVAYNPENPIPFLWVAAGKLDKMFRAQPTQTGIGVRYEPIDRLLSREELLDAIKIEKPETFQRDLQLYERFLNVFQKALRIVQEQSRPNLKGELGLRSLAGYLMAKVKGDDSELRKTKITKRTLQQLDKLFEQFGDLGRHEGWAMAYGFRQIVRPFFRGGEYGRYFTPPEVIQFLVSATDPKPKERILDFACGSGGFLGQAARHLLETHKAPPDEIAECLFGCDIDDTCMIATRTFLELMLPEKQKKLNIWRKDGLTARKRFGWEDEVEGFDEGQFDVVLSNPPAGKLPSDFGFLESEGYQFAGKGKGRQNLYEVAFLEQAIKMVKDGGRIGIVLPEGIFANAQLKPVRDWLLKTVTVEAVVSLPRGIFPFTPSKMCAVVMRKVKPRKKRRTLLAEVSRKGMLNQLQEILKTLKECH
ncbi:MAG: N-6 DNA methylase [Armatimonadota bacterium]|nr:N-6 DNA methylase [Armatimonadota bacterium]